MILSGEADAEPVLGELEGDPALKTFIDGATP